MLKRTHRAFQYAQNMRLVLVGHGVNGIIPLSAEQGCDFWRRLAANARYFVFHGQLRIEESAQLC